MEMTDIIAMLLEAYRMGYDDGQNVALESELDTTYIFGDEDEEVEDDELFL